MKIFEHFNNSGEPCPICNTRDDKPAVLIAIDGTQFDGICEAMQVHIDCIELTAYKTNEKILFAMAI